VKSQLNKAGGNMSCIFIIVNKCKIQVFERNERYQNVRIRIKCETDYFMNHEDYTQTAQLLASEIKDELNIKDYSSHTILFIYDRIKTTDTVKFITAFQDAKFFQQMTLGNAITLISIAKKWYDKEKKLFISFENTKYEIMLNEYRYFVTKESSAASMYKLDANELISYLSGICAE
jgi:hypothetical protein